MIKNELICFVSTYKFLNYTLLDKSSEKKYIIIFDVVLAKNKIKHFIIFSSITFLHFHIAVW
jgi:hypothetical protein